MALIKCPECGKEISDKSKQCIHCGCPLEEMMLINGKEVSKKIFQDFLDGKTKKYDLLVYLIQSTGSDLCTVDKKVQEILRTKQIPNTLYLAPKQKQNTPKCPMCNSTNLEKITAPKRIFSAGIFGLGSSKVGKTMECRNCGYKW